MARFTDLKPAASYLITAAEDGSELSAGVQGAAAMLIEWPEGAEAWEIAPNED